MGSFNTKFARRLNEIGVVNNPPNWEIIMDFLQDGGVLLVDRRVEPPWIKLLNVAVQKPVQLISFSAKRSWMSWTDEESEP